MTAPLKSIEGTGDIAATMAELGRRGRAAARVLALAPTERKDRALAAMAKAIRATTARIMAANAEDLTDARKAGATGAFLDRLTLTEARIEAVAAGIEVVQGLKDPVARKSTPGPGRTACASPACACRSASSASFTRAAPT